LVFIFCSYILSQFEATFTGGCVVCTGSKRKIKW